MCTWIEVEKLDGSGDVVTTAGELAALLCCDPCELVSESGRGLSADECLCDLDEQATGKKFGYRVEMRPVDGFDVLMTQEAA